jgi:hypothetical protein
MQGLGSNETGNLGEIPNAGESRTKPYSGGVSGGEL